MAVTNNRPRFQNTLSLCSTFSGHGNSFFQTKGKSETSYSKPENYKWFSFVDRQKCWATMGMCKLMWAHSLLVEISTQHTCKKKNQKKNNPPLWFFFNFFWISVFTAQIAFCNWRPTHGRKHLNICIWYRYPLPDLCHYSHPVSI